MRRQGNYERAEEYLATIDDEIEFEYGLPFSQLSKEDKEQALLEHFFKGQPQYKSSAQDLNDGITYTSSEPRAEISVDRITIRGAERRVVRDSVTGRFKKWLSE